MYDANNEAKVQVNLFLNNLKKNFPKYTKGNKINAKIKVYSKIDPLVYSILNNISLIIY